MKKQEKSSPTVKAEWSEPCLQIKTPVIVHPAGRPSLARKVEAVWDTGAEYSGISEALVEQMQLRSVGSIKERYADGNPFLAPAYYVHVKINGRGLDVLATSHKDKSLDLVLGMYVIQKGTFHIEPTKDGGTRFEFTI